jgi:hypothetical protein
MCAGVHLVVRLIAYVPEYITIAVMAATRCVRSLSLPSCYFASMLFFSQKKMPTGFDSVCMVGIYVYYVVSSMGEGVLVGFSG